MGWLFIPTTPDTRTWRSTPSPVLVLLIAAILLPSCRPSVRCIPLGESSSQCHCEFEFDISYVVLMLKCFLSPGPPATNTTKLQEDHPKSYS